MFFLREQLSDRRTFFPGGDHVILSEAIFEGVSVFAVKKGEPARLLTQVLEDTVVLLGQHLDALLCVPAREGQLGKHVLLLGQGLCGRAVVDDVQCGLTPRRARRRPVSSHGAAPLDLPRIPRGQPISTAGSGRSCYA